MLRRRYWVLTLFRILRTIFKCLKYSYFMKFCSRECQINENNLIIRTCYMHKIFIKMLKGTKPSQRNFALNLYLVFLCIFLFTDSFTVLVTPNGVFRISSSQNELTNFICSPSIIIIPIEFTFFYIFFFCNH